MMTQYQVPADPLPTTPSALQVADDFPVKAFRFASAPTRALRPACRHVHPGAGHAVSPHRAATSRPCCQWWSPLHLWSPGDGPCERGFQRDHGGELRSSCYRRPPTPLHEAPLRPTGINPLNAVPPYDIPHCVNEGCSLPTVPTLRTVLAFRRSVRSRWFRRSGRSFFLLVDVHPNRLIFLENFPANRSGEGVGLRRAAGSLFRPLILLRDLVHL